MARSLSDLRSAAAVQAALDEFLRLGQQGFLRKYGFGRASNYLVRDPHSGQWADSKAIVGAALAWQSDGEPSLRAAAFSGGMATVVRKLESLGFEVSTGEEITGQPWRQDEVDLIVADYLVMLQCELAGQPYNKTAHRRRLLQSLPGRSAGSIEFKHCNISAVMLSLGFPYIPGYAPRANFQRSLLVATVSRQVLQHPQLDALALSAVERPAVVSTLSDFSRVVTEAPPLRRVPPPKAEEARVGRSPIRRDYLAREEHNRSLGQAGEEFAVRFEQWRLARSGAGQLAERVRHVSVADGDGLGYDIHSFETDGSDRFIEVKTTSFGERTPFYVSDNELRFARQHDLSYRLYRLFDFRKAPRLFELAGAVENHCQLDATTFRASFG